MGRAGKQRLRLKRAYEPASPEDGTRILVERLWPRGVTKAALDVAFWAKEAAPSTALRQWFGHEPQRWTGFRTRYFRELDARPDAWQPIVDAARRGTVTLVYSARDEEHNNAVALREYLERRRKGGSSLSH